jgi:hypothetical protein
MIPAVVMAQIEDAIILTVVAVLIIGFMCIKIQAANPDYSLRRALTVVAICGILAVAIEAILVLVG